MKTEDLLPPRERTLPAMLARQARLFGDRPFLEMPGARWSHRDAAKVAARRGAALRAAGIARGHRVALIERDDFAKGRCHQRFCSRANRDPPIGLRSGLRKPGFELNKAAAAVRVSTP